MMVHNLCTFLYVLGVEYCSSSFLYVQGDEYCTTETFLAECPDNQLIMMTEAQYGMMERNRCVDPNGDMSKILSANWCHNKKNIYNTKKVTRMACLDETPTAGYV